MPFSVLQLAILGSITAATAQPAAGPLVSRNEADHLVLAELIDEHRRRLPGLVVSTEPISNPPLYWIVSVDWDERVNGEQYGTGHFGYFAVYRPTGDVWEATSCGDERHSPVLVREQWRWRHRQGITARMYRELRRNEQDCGWWAEPVE